MARQLDVQYVRYYTDGSAARNIAPSVSRKTQSLPKYFKKKRSIVVHVDPVAIAGILCGPVASGIIGALGDLFCFLLAPMGAYFPGWTINGLLVGLLYGIFLSRTSEIVMFCNFEANSMLILSNI